MSDTLEYHPIEDERGTELAPGDYVSFVGVKNLILIIPYLGVI